MTISGAVYREGVAYSPDGAVYVQHTDGATQNDPVITGTVTGAPKTLAQWGVPCILASSGSMADNGAVSAMTALPTTYSNGAWLYLPANAIEAGSAAGFYWFVASSTTAGTVYNSTWDGTGIPAIGTTTAFATTGPGAFNGIAAGEIVCATVTIAAGGLGASGRVFVQGSFRANTAAGAKTPRIRYSGAAGTVISSNGATTEGGYAYQAYIQNQGVVGGQIATSYFNALNSSAGVSFTNPAANTAAATTIVFSLEKATATNHAIWDCGGVMLLYSA